VTPFAPWAAIRDCVNHHEPSQRISLESAFRAHTRGGWRAAGIENRGFLDVGQPASFAVWSLAANSASGGADLPDLSPGATLPINLRTVIGGRTVFDLEGVS
jgi:predicted amidohydrolase YtcJ